MTEFPPTTEEIFETFEDLPDFDDRIDFLIDLGRELPPLSEELQAEENLVAGCMSTVWLKMTPGATANDPIAIRADSDSLLVKGLIVILMSFYHDKTAAEIVESNVAEYLQQLGLDQHLSPQRRNGLFSMIKRINALALQISAP